MIIYTNLHSITMQVQVDVVITKTTTLNTDFINLTIHSRYSIGLGGKCGHADTVRVRVKVGG